MKSKNLKNILMLVVAIVAAVAIYYAAVMMKFIPAQLQEQQQSEVKVENQQVSPITTTEKLAEFVIEIKDNKFVPDVLEVPAGKDFHLIVRNTDKTIEEFESTELKKEKLVKGGKEIVLNISALKPGEYKFFGEFHPRTAQGKLVAK